MISSRGSGGAVGTLVGTPLIKGNGVVGIRLIVGSVVEGEVVGTGLLLGAAEMVGNELGTGVVGTNETDGNMVGTTETDGDGDGGDVDSVTST